MSGKHPATRRTQLLTLLYSMKQQGKESATFNIDFLIEACQEKIKAMLVTRKLSSIVAQELSGLWLSPERSNHETNRISPGVEENAI